MSPGGPKMRPKWAPEGLPGGVWAPLLGCSWVVVGASWRAPGGLEPCWGLLGRFWGLPRAWGSFGPRGGLLLELLGPLLKAPLRNRENLEIR